MTRAMMTGAAMAALLAACGGDEPQIEDEVLEAREAVAEDAADGSLADAEGAVQGEAEAAAFLAETGARDGVETLPSGTMVERIEEGTGASPTAEDVVRLDYEIRFADGRLLDSSEANGAPVVLPSYEVMALPGILEVMPTLKEGGRARVVMPADQAFVGAAAETGQPVPPEMAGPMVFDVTLVEVIGRDDEARLTALQEEETARMDARRAEMEAEMTAQAERNAAASATFLEEARGRDGVETTGSGLAYRVVERGEGGASPTATDRVTVNYRGTLPDGTEFDSSYSRGVPATFGLDQVIPGWTEGVQLMEVGDTYEFFVPSDLAYGAQGTPGGPIGPDQALIFTVELLGIEGEEPAPAE